MKVGGKGVAVVFCGCRHDRFPLGTERKGGGTFKKRGVKGKWSVSSHFFTQF